MTLTPQNQPLLNQWQQLAQDKNWEELERLTTEFLAHHKKLTVSWLAAPRTQLLHKQTETSGQPEKLNRWLSDSPKH